MTRTVGFQLVLYSFLLAGISYVVKRSAPSLSSPTFETGVAGGAVCLLLGIRALCGHRGKGLAILALIPISFVMLSQSVMTWGSEVEAAAAPRSPALTITFLFVVSMGMLARVAYAGVSFAPPANGGVTCPEKER